MDNSSQQWTSYLQEYETKRSTLPWTEAPPIQRVRHSDVKAKETQYNPILQTYKNSETVTFTQETKIRQQEDKRLISTLAQNKDRALRYEQVFNIINLENKLQGLEGQPGYPEEKEHKPVRSEAATSKAKYNIISNLDFHDHSYLPPEQRPPKEQEKPRQYTISAVEYRDFDIITNRYLQNHDQKVYSDQLQYKHEAAAKYWKTHDYDIVKGEFVDEDKEKEFVVERQEKAKTHGKDWIERLPYGIKYSESALYQPINMTVVDEQRLYEIDMKNKLAKQRYEWKYDLEQDYRIRDAEQQERANVQALNRKNHKRYNETRERGYNIISNNPFEGRFAEKLVPLQTKPQPGVWEKTMAYSLNQGGNSRQSAPSEQPKMSVPHSKGPSSQMSIRSSGFR